MFLLSPPDTSLLLPSSVSESFLLLPFYQPLSSVFLALLKVFHFKIHRARKLIVVYCICDIEGAAKLKQECKYIQRRQKVAKAK